MTDKKPKKKLTPQQKYFCELYATNRDFFGNGTQAYIEAYNVDLTKKGGYMVAKSGAYENLTKPYLLKHIRSLMELGGLSNERVDKELLFLIEQNAELGNKLGAIKEFNKVNGRIIDKGEVDTTMTVNIVNYDSNK